MLAGKVFSFTSQVADLLPSLLLAHAGDQVARFLQPLGGAAGFRFSTLLRSTLLSSRGILHVARCLLQPLDRLIELLVATLTLPLPHRLLLLLLPLLFLRLPLLASLLLRLLARAALRALLLLAA